MLSYTTGDAGLALSCDSAVLLTSAPVAEVTEIWEACDGRNLGFERILTSLCCAGVAHLTDFALVSFEDDTGDEVHVAARGDVEVTVDGHTVSGAGAHTWNEECFSQVTQLTARLATSVTGAVSLPLRAGVVTANTVEWVSNAPEDHSHTVLIDARAGNYRVPVPVEEAAQPNEPVADRTVVRRNLPHWMLRFTTGQVIGVGDRVVVGRRPTPVDGVGGQLEQLLSPQREVSANHALLVGETDGVLLTDLGSTNGTVVTPSEGAEFLVQDGRQLLVREGDRIDFGDGNIAECVRATPL